MKLVSFPSSHLTGMKYRSLKSIHHQSALDVKLPGTDLWWDLNTGDIIEVGERERQKISPKIKDLQIIFSNWMTEQNFQMETGN